jgi:hypothetical protein
MGKIVASYFSLLPIDGTVSVPNLDGKHSHDSHAQA